MRVSRCVSTGVSGCRVLWGMSPGVGCVADWSCVVVRGFLLCLCYAVSPASVSMWGWLCGVVRRCPALPPGGPGSTLGAGGLSFRVRDGSGRFPAAMAAATVWNPACQPSARPCPPGLVGVGVWLGVREPGSGCESRWWCVWGVPHAARHGCRGCGVLSGGVRVGKPSAY